MKFLLHRLPEVIAFGVVLAAQMAFALLWIRRTRGPDAPRKRALILGAWGLSALVLAWSLVSTAGRVQAHLPRIVNVASRGTGIAWALFSLVGMFAIVVLWLLPRPRTHHSTARRGFLLALRSAVIGVPAAAMGYGVFIGRHDLRLKEVQIGIPGLPRDLDGLRIVQLTDIHLSPFLSRAELRRAVDMANETRAHLALVTGDLITGHGDPLDDCIAELKLLHADAGVIGCHGNHEVYANCLEYATKAGARAGIEFLRSRNRVLQFGSARINFAGVDYQRFREPYLVDAERLVVPGTFNVLLSHNPDVLPVAERQGYALTISGHTHGGQISMEILDQDINFARFYTPYVYGIYRHGRAVGYVGRGIGTVGVPARVGAPPEVALIRLCAI